MKNKNHEKIWKKVKPIVDSGEALRLLKHEVLKKREN